MAEVAAGYFTLLCSVIVFMMQLGFALLETGQAPSKHAQNVFMKNLLDMVCNALAFWAVGYALAMGKDAGGFVGTTEFFLGDSSHSANWFLQWVFATNASTIFGGSIAGRTKFAAYVVIACVTAGISYATVVHWVWHPDGWLHTIGTNGVIDFAGSGVVHLAGGVVGLVACKVVGPRVGRFTPEGNVRPMPGHSIVTAMTGVGILWVSWFAFNMASAAALPGTNGVETAARVAVATTLSPAAALLSLFWYRRWAGLHYSLNEAGNSVLAGLVAITAPCATVPSWAAVVIGVIAAVVYNLSSRLMIKLRLDDPLDAAPVHMFCGAWGMIATGLFSSQQFVRQVAEVPTSEQYGLLLGGGIEQLGLQALAVVVICVWVATITLVTLLLLRHFNVLRVDLQTERAGLDLMKHNTAAFPEFQLVDPFEATAAINRQRSRDGRDRDADAAEEPSREVIVGLTSSGDDGDVDTVRSPAGVRIGAEFDVSTPRTGDDYDDDDDDDDETDDDELGYGSGGMTGADVDTPAAAVPSSSS